MAVDEQGALVLAKCASTPPDPSEGLITGLELLAAELGTNLRDLLAQTDTIVHGTTVATNALLERKGARVGLLTTEGHRDVIEMREGLKDDRYNLRMAPPIPLVPRARRLGVRERLRFDGTVAIPLSLPSLRAGMAALAKARVEAVAVCYLHSYRNPRHEKLTGRELARRFPGVYVSLSAEVLPQIKEYERVWTTVVNAYVGPALARYLASLAARLTSHGYRGDVLIMQSHGGVAPVRESTRLAAGAVLSGPAGGVAAGRYCARLLGEASLITFDMGGTSTDIALLQGGEPQLTGEKTVGVAKVALPAIDIHTLGAGGGSVAWVDAGRILHVGPESAGAEPGPACYGKGGTRATVTDANLVLGFLDPGELPRRPHPSRRQRGARRRRRDRDRARHDGAPGGRRHHRASSTPTWPRESRSSRCAAASIRAGSRWSPSAAPRGSTSPRSRGSSRSGASSCRRSPPCSRRGACWRPTCATSSCART